VYPLTRENFTGPWAGLPVAWDDDDEFDESTYRADVARCAAHGVPGVYTAGTTGEFYALSEDEFRAVTRAAVEEAHAHAMPAMIGCTATSTRGALARIGWALRSGADAVQIALPFWMPLADHEIVPFFTGLAQAAGPMALSVYETERSKRTLTVDQHRRIRDTADNYVMVKANSGTVGAAPQGCRALSEFVNVFAGEHLWAELAPTGVIGCCSSAVYANPDVALALFRDLAAGNLAGLAAGAARLRALYEFLFGEFAGRGFQDSAWDRLVGNATGFLQAGTRCRRPYSSPDHRDVQRVRDWISRNAPELLWAGR
jgi:4-hydroxy-tetrahydrodipicolinate synthase